MKRRERRRATIRKKIFGDSQRPRLVVFRSLKHIYGQIIDDTAGRTLAAASDLMVKEKKGGKTTLARRVGELLAKKAAVQKITRVVFDRGGFRYAGRIKALADGCRQKLKF